VKSWKGESVLSDPRLIIAIDGPAGAGKSTAARQLARRLGYLFVSTGAMYRAIGWKVIQHGIPLDDIETVSRRIGKLADGTLIELAGDGDAVRVFVDGREITAEIATPEVSHAASIVSTISAVRRALVSRQQEMGQAGGVVMEGRDIGTCVFPNAHVKIYLDASTEARSRRRFAEDATRNFMNTSLEQMKADIEERDSRDKTRADSPLVQAEDAIYIDSSDMTIDEVVEKMLEIVRARKRDREIREIRENI
jgi:CMP/dCMP kinase